MSRTAIFLNNETTGTISVSSVDGHIQCEQREVSPNEVAVAASIGDPGNAETATTGNIWIDVGPVLIRAKIRKRKKENAELLDYEGYGYTVVATNDYPESGSVYSKSVTLHISQ